MRATVAWFFFSRRRLNSRLPATSRPADQAEWPAALSTVSAIQAFRLFLSVRAATVAARCTAGETLRGILPATGESFPSEIPPQASSGTHQGDDVAVQHPLIAVFRDRNDSP